MMEYYKEESGAHLDEIEDEEEYIEKWMEWVMPKITIKYGRKKRLPPTKWDQKIEQIRKEDPTGAHLVDQLQGPDIPHSYVDSEFLPDERGYYKELDRIKSNIGRYPIGFRHYENFQNYVKQYPDRTIDEYVNDINSQISFEEYLLLT